MFSPAGTAQRRWCIKQLLHSDGSCNDTCFSGHLAKERSRYEPEATVLRPSSAAHTKAESLLLVKILEA